jgi:asparagine synthase (glutamine-hydrolysing)
METNSKCWQWKPFFATATLDASDCMLDSPTDQVCRDPALPHLSVIGSFEIHNRKELASTLGLGRFSLEWPDARLILHSYARWGASTLEHLEGQFSLALLDQRRRSVFACVDHLGSLPLLYRTQGTRFVVAGDMQTMLRPNGCPRELNAGALLTFGRFDRLPAVPGETPHKGVLSLPAGHFLTADGRGVKLGQYWRPSIRPELVPSNENAVYEQARHLVETAVANRLRGKDRVAIMLSGGLDSSALAAVAANYLRGKGRTLLALCAVNDPANKAVPDERPFIEKLRCLENVEIQYVDSAGKGPFDGIEDPTQFESCPRLPVLRSLFQSLYRAAESHGSEIVINGGGGELGISGTPAGRFMEQAVGLGWLALARELSRTASLRQTSAVRLFASEAWHYYSPPRGSSAFFLNPQFRCDWRTRSKRRVPLWPNSRGEQLGSLLNALDRGALPATLPAEFILGCTRPLRDKNLLEFCMAVPSRFKAKDGFGRLMIRKSFESMLPKDVAWRGKNLWACPDYNWRYNAQVGSAKEFVRAIRKSDPVREIVDVDRLEQAMVPIEDLWMRPGVPRFNNNALAGVPETINLINFLRQFPPFRRS